MSPIFQSDVGSISAFEYPDGYPDEYPDANSEGNPVNQALECVTLVSDFFEAIRRSASLYSLDGRLKPQRTTKHDIF